MRPPSARVSTPTGAATSSRPTRRSSPPGWASDDPGERAALQGLIKLAAAYVHDVRGNPPGIAKNLDGARARLIEARDAGWRPPAGLGLDVDLDVLIADIDQRLADLAIHPADPTLGPPRLQRSPA